MSFPEYIQHMLRIIHKHKLNPKDFLLKEVHEWYKVGCLPEQTFKFMR